MGEGRIVLIGVVAGGAFDSRGIADRALVANRQAVLVAAFGAPDRAEFGFAGLGAAVEIVEDRYDCRSTIVTSQLPVNSCHDAIGDATLADAILDRLVHNAHRLALKGKESIRKTKAVAAA